MSSLPQERHSDAASDLPRAISEDEVIPLRASNPDSAAERYRRERMTYWGTFARQSSRQPLLGSAYRRRLLEVYRSLVPSQRAVLEIGCSKGDLLADLRPSYGVGVDFSADMLVAAKGRHQSLHFIHADAHEGAVKKSFDFIILSDLINDLWDVQEVLEQLRRTCTSRTTRLILTTHSRLWELPLRVVGQRFLGIRWEQQNWLTPHEIRNLLYISGYDLLREQEEILVPFAFPVLSTLCNRFLVKLPPFNLLGLAKFMIARPLPIHQEDAAPSVSIIIPARNEAGHIEDVFRRIPQLGKKSELIFVEGHSSDNTYDAIRDAIAVHPEHECRLFRQTGRGKWDAVQLGLQQARGDLIVILDADLSIAPEELPRFVDILRDHRGEFVNSVRMTYPQEKEAMKFMNLLGNKVFAWMLSQVLGQRIGDALGGMKGFWRKDYEAFARDPSYLGALDPFGDFALLFGAAKWNLKIIDVPVRYRRRSYGATNIQRWQDGWKLFRMLIRGALAQKFI